MNKDILEFEHDGLFYQVHIAFEIATIDDSFDGHLGGYVYTFESSHREIDLKSLEVIRCLEYGRCLLTEEETVEDIEPEDVKGLMDEIKYHAEQIDLNQWHTP